MRTIKILALLTFLFSAIFAFNINILANSEFQTNLYGTEWKLTKINGEFVMSDRAFIKFDNKEKRVGGNSACNSFSGSLIKNESKMKFSKILSTRMFCQDSQELEIKFLGNLIKVANYQIKGGTLYLKSVNKILLEFEPKK